MLIPVTVLATCVVNLVSGARNRSLEHERTLEPGHTRNACIRPGLAMGFGLIHGLGSSNFLRAALGD